MVIVSPCPRVGLGVMSAMTHSLDVALPVTEEFPFGVPCALLLLAISCTVFLTALPSRISAVSGASAVACLWLPNPVPTVPVVPKKTVARPSF